MYIISLIRMELLMIISQHDGLLGRYKSLTGKEINGVKELAELASKDKAIRDLFTEFGDNAAFFLAPWLKKFKLRFL